MEKMKLVLTALLMLLTIAGISLKNAHAAGEVAAWGANGLGQLGDGTTVGKSTPVQVLGLTGITSVTGGGQHSLALKNDGSVWAWGYNGEGELGDGTTVDKSTPVQVLGLTGITAIATRAYHSLALKNDGSVWAWGYNFDGQLGDGTTGDKSTPVQVLGLTGITAVAAGGGHSLALKNDGTAWAWGGNNSGQLGDGTDGISGRNYKSTPVQVLGLTGITAIAAGSGHSLAIKNDGNVWAWGDNWAGELGDGTYNYGSNTPVQILGFTGITAVAAGWSHSLAIKNDGTAWAWGYGPVGDGTWGSKSTPVQVLGITNVTAIAGGGYHSLAIGHVMQTSPANYINKAIADVKSAAYIGPGKQQNALLDKLNNALSAIQTDPPNTTLALAEMNDFYIILCNMKKQGKIDSDTYTMLYNDYVSIVTSLGGSPKPAC